MSFHLSGFFGFISDSDEKKSLNDLISSNKMSHLNIQKYTFFDVELENLLSMTPFERWYNNIHENVYSCISIWDNENNSWYIVCRINSSKPMIFYKNHVYYYYNEKYQYHTKLLKILVDKVCLHKNNSNHEISVDIGISRVDKIISLIPNQYIDSKINGSNSVLFMFNFTNDCNVEQTLEKIIDITEDNHSIFEID